jgi:hypothetical protein
MDSEEKLMAFLRANPPAKKFVPYSYLNKASDALTVYFEGDPDYSERLSEHVTLYRSLETKEIVGCRIKGIAGVLEDLPNYIHVDHDGLNLGLVFLACRDGRDEKIRQAMNELAKTANERGMELQPSLQ